MRLQGGKNDINRLSRVDCELLYTFYGTGNSLNGIVYGNSSSVLDTGLER